RFQGQKLARKRWQGSRPPRQQAGNVWSGKVRPLDSPEGKRQKKKKGDGGSRACENGILCVGGVSRGKVPCRCNMATASSSGRWPGAGGRHRGRAPAIRC